MNPNSKLLLTNQNPQQRFRLPLLAVLLIGVVAVTGKTILMPMQGNESFTAYAFPEQVPLPGWQLQSNRILNSQTSKEAKPYDESLAGISYTYIQNNIPLNIEMRYVVATLGHVPSLIKHNAPVQVKQLDKQIDQQYLPGVGFVGRFSDQTRAYLSTCINPDGGSTFTGAQFVQNRSLYDLRPERLLPILSGQESLRDRRCLWVHMSIPLNNQTPEQAYQILEKAWVPWFQWWSLRFPKP